VAGAGDGFASFAAYVPGAGLGVVALSNSGTPVDAAGIAALRALADARWDRDDGHGAAGSDATLELRHG
jgi:CubicO group peptidase (beta-lactamase class C family)